MVRHVILWKLKSDIPEDKRGECKTEAKRRLESLLGKIDGLKEITVHTDGLDSSSADMMLDTVFIDNDALKAYQKNPIHIEAATYVRSVVEQRLCLDFEV